MSDKPTAINNRAILVGFGVKPESLEEVRINLSELHELATAAGADVVGMTWQLAQKYQAATLIGSGKVSEIKKMVDDTDSDLVIIDHTLSGIQIRNLEDHLKARVLDRNQLILDIFAQRAQTYEGKLQVELAQLLDQMPRMVGAWLGSLSRLGGGIGTRGPGEKAIELDRRVVNQRADQIRKRLEQVRKSRKQHRQSRKKQKVPSFALIGYTNSGKSSLLNQLTNADILAKDQVFATLDPTTRKVKLPHSMAVITDTVGFINKLPPQLIDAFKATLEESAEADILLHVIDLSNPQMARQIAAVDALIEEFGWQEKPILHVFNKVDIASPEKQFQVSQFPRVFISARTGEGMEALKDKMSSLLSTLLEETELFFPRENENLIYDLARVAEITRREPASQGTICYAKIPPHLISQWSAFSVNKQMEEWE